MVIQFKDFIYALKNTYAIHAQVIYSLIYSYAIEQDQLMERSGIM
ncbi:hypothetical protein MGWOODY_Mmi2647 [hydrothermal vent metagenome]|uniref:Uncharacterized protein n=1 Tax=hydrothermal vent metagenome TaxID=652676 RepID=A0A160VGH9_9ZZZZ